LPNIISFLVVNIILTLAGSIGMETGLTMLGYGLPVGTPSLGRLINMAQQDPITMQQRLWIWMPAVVLIFIMILCLYIVGNAVQRAVDPKQQQQR
jgi:peptide/nickel transport system permease protein